MRTPKIETSGINVGSESKAPTPNTPAIMPVAGEKSSVSEVATATFISLSASLMLQVEPTLYETVPGVGQKIMRPGKFIKFMGGYYRTSLKKEIEFILKHDFFNARIFADPSDPTGYWAEYLKKFPESESMFNAPGKQLAADTAGIAAEAQTAAAIGVSPGSIISQWSPEPASAEVGRVENDGRLAMTEAEAVERGYMTKEPAIISVDRGGLPTGTVLKQ